MNTKASKSKTFVENGWRLGDETSAEIIKLMKDNLSGWLYKRKAYALRCSGDAIKTRITVTVTVEDV